MAICSIDWCSKPVMGRGWCSAHYGKWRKYGDPRAVHVHIRPRCSVVGCRAFHHAKGMCANHYAASKVQRVPKRDRTAELFARILMLPDCWIWMGQRVDGYGRFQFYRETIQAHRAVYEHFRGPIPDGLVIDHLCRVHECVNPLHLEPVTQRTNVLRGIAPTAENAAKTHCKWGHELSGSNLILRPDGRECRACARRHQAASRARKRGAA